MEFKLLKSQNEFDKYSKDLQKFEKQFDYPLGDKKFHINHGGDSIEYFDFFKRLGDVSYFVVLENNVIIGAGCAILKNIVENGITNKYWYLGDFKIIPEYRKKGLLKNITLKYFISHYIKSNKMIALNMSPMDNNGLVKKVKTLFSWFRVNVDPFYFYEWDHKTFGDEILSNSYIKDNFVLFTNNGYKDIVIENQSIPLYHLIDKRYGFDNYSNYIIPIEDFNIDDISDNSLFMFGTANSDIIKKLKDESIKHTSESTFISHKIDCNKCNFFTGEI